MLGWNQLGEHYQLNYIHSLSLPKISVLQQWIGTPSTGPKSKTGEGRGLGRETRYLCS